MKKFVACLVLCIGVECLADHTEQKQLFELLSAELLSMEARHALLMEHSTKLEKDLPRLREEFAALPLAESKKKTQELKPLAQQILNGLALLDEDI